MIFGGIFMTYPELLAAHIDELGRILIAFEMKSPAAIRMLEDEKRALALRYEMDGEGAEFYEPACYNALAVIRSAIEQEKINAQLAAYILEAKTELEEILEYMKGEE